ncbi:MAG: aminotransferase class V-fold PLP-dependent enzyme [Candidatus Saccharicenans sp.]
MSKTKIETKKISSRREFFKIFGGGLLVASSLPLAGQTSTNPLSRPADVQEPPIPRASGRVSPSDHKFWLFVREQFPITKNNKIIYMNNGTMGPSPYYTQWIFFRKEEEVNFTGTYGGHDVARARVARFINCQEKEVALTHNVTEGINIVAQGFKMKKGEEVIITNHEHAGNAIPWFTRARRDKIVVRVAPLGKDAAETLNNIERTITKKTRIISIPHMTCTNGQILPAREIIKLAHGKGILVLLDGAHPPGMFKVDVKDLDCDFYAACGHKFLMAPKGTGFLYVKESCFDRVEPIMTGGGSDSGWDYQSGLKGWNPTAHRYDYGTQSAALYYGLMAALDFVEGIGLDNITERDKMLATRLMKGLSQIPQVELLTPWEGQSRCALVGFRLKNMPYDKFQNWLMENYKIRIRGVGESKLNSLRVTTHIYNTEDEVDLLLEAVKKAASLSA